jgi:hypothetical protein
MQSQDFLKQVQRFSSSSLKRTQTHERHLETPSNATFGLVSAPLIYDPPSILASKIDKLMKLIQQCDNIVALTGAGMFTTPTNLNAIAIFPFITKY